MQLLSVAFLFANFLAPTLPSQKPITALEPADLVVVAKNWRKVERAIELDQDPFLANDQARETLRARRQTAVANKVRTRGSETPLPPKSPIVLSTTQPGGSSDLYAYSYSVKVRNNGTKTARLLVWDYVFTDPVTMEEVGRLRLRAPVKIGPGKSSDLVGFSNTPPTRVIDARNPDRSKTRLNERVEINRIEYDDATYWQRPDL